MAGGVLPMIKHVPGHGRAMADSHKELPAVDLPVAELEKTDFSPFKGLSDMPLAMTAHILFPQIDPERPATVSSLIIDEIVRGYIGFEGLVVSDDVTMAALSGTDRERAEQTRKAGCDIVLHCYADLPQMQEIASGSRIERNCWQVDLKTHASDCRRSPSSRYNCASSELDELLKA